MHYTQTSRRESLEQVKKAIAKRMPGGIPDSELKSFLSVNFGFSPRKVTEYLQDLVNVGAIELDENMWKMNVSSHAEARGAAKVLNGES